MNSTCIVLIQAGWLSHPHRSRGDNSDNQEIRTVCRCESCDSLESFLKDKFSAVENSIKRLSNRVSVLSKSDSRYRCLHASDTRRIKQQTVLIHKVQGSVVCQLKLKKQGLKLKKALG